MSVIKRISHHKVQVKICGIKTIDEVQIINKYPVDYIGFIFATSKRQLTVKEAICLRKLIRKDIKVVGVFVNEELSKVLEIINKCQLDIIQLHGEESVEYCKEVPIKVWKSMKIKDIGSLSLINQYSPHVSGILLDTYNKTEKGGTGKTFDWNLVKDLSKREFIILAGGLNPCNIKEAIKKVNPNIVDVNSGVETKLIKDEKKIKELFKQLKEA